MDKRSGIESFHPDFPLDEGCQSMKELAEFLKNARLESNLSVEALSGLSGISVSMLESFENMDFERFGAAVLLRNTVRAYCQALHLEAEPLLTQYASQIEACNVQEEGIKRYARLQKTLYKRRRMVALPVLVLLLSAAGVFYGGDWIAKRRSKLYAPPDANRIFSQQNLPAELQELKPATAQKAKTAKPAPVKAPQATGSGPAQTAAAAKPAQTVAAPKPVETADAAKPAQTAAAANNRQDGSPKAVAPDEKAAATQVPQGEATVAPGVTGAVQNAEAHTLNKFTVQADSTVWIQVKIDGRKTRSEMLHAGDHREWVAAKTMEVIVGNAGGLQMKWNDQPLAAPHVSGRVLRFRLPDYAKPVKG
jgi:cytoskeleton protein RodZ